MITVSDFEYEFEQEYPKVFDVLKNGGLTVHEGVQKITLHGSRGPRGGFRDDSDLDLCLIVDTAQYPDIKEDAERFHAIIDAIIDIIERIGAYPSSTHQTS